MDEQHGDLRRPESVLGAALVRIEAAEQPCAQPHERIHEPSGELHITCDLADYRPRRGIAAVGDDSDDILRQLKAGGHQHGRRAHGYADRHDRHVPAEAFVYILYPFKAVPPLQNAEAQAFAPACAVRTLVDEQSIAAGLKSKLKAAAEIPHGVAAVAVEEYLHRRAGSGLIVPPVQAQPVLGRDEHVLKGYRLRGVDRFEHFVAELVVLLAFGQQMRVVGAALGDGKDDAVAQIRRGNRYGSRRREQYNKKPVPIHFFTLPRRISGRRRI